jgi:hypothetical protein
MSSIVAFRPQPLRHVLQKLHGEPDRAARGGIHHHWHCRPSLESITWPIPHGSYSRSNTNTQATIDTFYIFAHMNFGSHPGDASVAKTTKVKVSGRALFARINRALIAEDMQLKVSRSERMRLDVGPYYVINTRINGIVQAYKYLSLEEIAEKVGVLKEWEEMADDE